MEQPEFDKLFHDALHPHEVMPSDNVWAKLSQQLDEQADKKTRVIPLFWYMRIAASLLLVASALYWYAGKSHTKDNYAAKKPTQQKIYKQAESVERLAITEPEPKPKPKQTTLPAKTQPQTTPKAIPKNEKPQPKIFKPAPTRTELMAIDIKHTQPKIIPYDEEEQQAGRFTEAYIIINPTLQPQKQQTKQPFLKTLFANKNKVLKPRRRIKFLGIQTDKAFAFLKN